MRFKTASMQVFTGEIRCLIKAYFSFPAQDFLELIVDS